MRNILKTILHCKSIKLLRRISDLWGKAVKGKRGEAIDKFKEIRFSFKSFESDGERQFRR
jgi:hypothetical protein